MSSDSRGKREEGRKDRKTKGRKKVKIGSRIKLDLKPFLLTILFQDGASLSLGGEINGYCASCVVGTLEPLGMNIPSCSVPWVSFKTKKGHLLEAT